MSAENKVPVIRFEGFSGEWKFWTVDELINDQILLPPKDGNHGNIHPKSADFVNFGIPFIMANNVKGGEVEVYGCSHISKKQADSLQKGFAKEGDVLLTHKGTVGEVAIVPKSEFPYLMLTPQVTYYRILRNEFLNIYFLSASFVTRKFQKKLKEEAGGGTRAYIGITEQQKLGISTPVYKEQTKIGQYFQQLDTLITQHQQKHDKLLQLKKSLLEKMFPKQGANEPEIRFKGFSGAWETKKLENLTDSPFSNGVFNDPDKVGYGYRLINVKDMYSGSSIDIDSLSLIDISKKEFLKNKVEYGDIFFTRSSLVKEGIAYSNVNLSDHKGLTFDGHLIRMQPCKKTTDSIFLSYAFKTDSARNQFILGGKTTTMTTIGQSDISEVEVAVATLKEQTKIGNLFKQLDTLIAQHQTQLKKLKQIKQACLEKMFV